MNLGTRIRTVLAIATSLNTALMATDITEFHNPTLDTIYKVVSICLNFIIVASVTYFNNDYTEVACEHTGEMRLKKHRPDDGENFFDGEDFEQECEEDA